MILAKILSQSCQDSIIILPWSWKILTRSHHDLAKISAWSYQYLAKISPRSYCNLAMILEDLVKIPSWSLLRSYHNLAKILSILILEVLDTISCHAFTMIIPKMSWFWKILVKGGFLRAQIALAPLRARSKWLKWDQLINICKSCYLRIFRIFVVDNRW
jgi:hypothetical protein